MQPGDEHTPKHGQAGLWSLLHRLGRSRWPALLRGDVAWGVEPVMARAEQDGLAYLFRLRMTANVKRALTKMMADRDWTAAGHGWQGKETTLRLVGWSRQRRIVLLRRKLDRPLVIGLDPTYGPPRCKGNFARSDLSSLRQPIRSQDLVLAKMEIRAPRSS